MFKVVYKDDFKLRHGIIQDKKNVLSWNSSVKNNQLPIIKIGWGLIWKLIKYRLKGNLYLLTQSSLNHDITYYDFFRIKK